MNVDVTSSLIHASYTYPVEGTGGSFGNRGAFGVVTMTVEGGATVI